MGKYEEKIYSPIITKIDSWLKYYATLPEGKYQDKPQEFDNHRKKYDLDCILTEGDLRADTIFSLWTPFKGVIYCMNNYREILDIKSGNNIYKTPEMLEKIRANIKLLLPADEPEVELLSQLFILGQKRCNVMILPDRRMNGKGVADLIMIICHIF